MIYAAKELKRLETRFKTGENTNRCIKCNEPMKFIKEAYIVTKRCGEKSAVGEMRIIEPAILYGCGQCNIHIWVKSKTCS